MVAVLEDAPGMDCKAKPEPEGRLGGSSIACDAHTTVLYKFPVPASQRQVPVTHLRSGTHDGMGGH